mgnify:CR=1 FL=1
MNDDAETMLDCLIERAAIIQEGEKCSRYIAELTAAKQAGFENWIEAESGLRFRIRHERASE